MEFILFYHQTLEHSIHHTPANLNICHHLHFHYEKSIIERTMQYIKDRTEIFDDYFYFRKKRCKLKHVKNWLNLFVDYHKKELCLKWTEPKIGYPNLLIY